jgi:hypothetical protein
LFAHVDLIFRRQYFNTQKGAIPKILTAVDRVCAIMIKIGKNVCEPLFVVYHSLHDLDHFARNKVHDFHAGIFELTEGSR